jgi:hypothetical protein
MFIVQEPSQYIIDSFSRDREYTKEVFLNAPYDKQVSMYAEAIRREYYEALVHLVELLPELPEEFMDDVNAIL